MKVVKHTIFMGRNYDLPVHHPSWELKAEDLCTHLLVCGGDVDSRTEVAKHVADGVCKLKRKIVVLSVTGLWRDVKFGRRTLTTGLEPESISRALEEKSFPNVVIEMKGVNPGYLNEYLTSLVSSLSSAVREESTKLRLLLVLDGIYNVIFNAFGPRCSSIFYLERSVREFRKWGMGVILTAEKLSYLTDPLRANFWTVIHLGTDDEKEVQKSSIYFREESPRLLRLHKGEALAISHDYWYGEPFRLKL